MMEEDSEGKGRTSTSLASASITDTWRVLWRVRYRVAGYCGVSGGRGREGARGDYTYVEGWSAG